MMATQRLRSTVDLDALVRGGVYADEDLGRDALAWLGLHDGLPFLLDETGRGDEEINAWIRSLPERGVWSKHTWDAYLSDVADLQRFLSRRGASLLTAKASHIAAYYVDRRRGSAERRVSRATWNRKIAAFDSYYGWARASGLCDEPPFSYRLSHVLRSDGWRDLVWVNQAREKGGRPHSRLRWLEPDQLRFLLDVGFGGLLPDGKPDPVFRGRQSARNRAVARVLATSGMRQVELVHLLIWEVPRLPNAPSPWVDLHLPAPITKRERERTTWLGADALRSLRAYLRLERRNQAAAGRWQTSRPIVVRDPDSEGGRIGGRRIRWDALDRDQRLRLVDVEGRPAVVALTASGTPVKNWNKAFEVAVNRCRTLDADFPKVSPHAMRHTFAVHTLRKLIRASTLAAAEIDARADEHADLAFYRGFEPLVQLKRLMGHASTLTTQMYLDAADPSRLIASRMLEEEDEPLGSTATGPGTVERPR